MDELLDPEDHGGDDPHRFFLLFLLLPGTLRKQEECGFFDLAKVLELLALEPRLLIADDEVLISVHEGVDLHPLVTNLDGQV